MSPDIFFLSFDEPNADENWLRLKAKFPHAKRVHGISGIAAAHKVCSELSSTAWYFLVDADNEVQNFDFQLPDQNLQPKSVYVWRALNPVNGLIYGYGAIKLFPKGLMESVSAKGLDLSSEAAVRYHIVDRVASITRFNSSPLQAWRSAFRECAKLSSQMIRGQKSAETLERLKIWTTVTLDVPFADWTLLGAKQGQEFGERNQNQPQELVHINDFQWLQESFSQAEKLKELVEGSDYSHNLSKSISPTFCLLPWVHLSTRPNGHMRLCCTANASSAGATNDRVWGGEVGILKKENGRPANLNHTPLLEGWNNTYMKDVRRDMLSGRAPASCQKCFKEEAAGHRSKRNWETEYWSKRVDLKQILSDTKVDGSVPAKLYYIDLRLGTKCNLKCVMCSPHDSSLWVSDWKKLYPQIENDQLREVMVWDNHGRVDGASYNWHQDNPVFWQQLYDQIPHMKQLYFAGGESTIIEEHYLLLEECIQRGEAHHIELRYNSNGIEMPDRLFELWSHFERVRFHYSIDSIFEMNDYIRFPSRWDQVEAQLRRLDETSEKVEVTIACAVQMLNMFYIPDFIQWKLQQGFKKINPYPLGAGLINWHFVYHPAHLNVKVFPQSFKEKIKNKFESFYPWLREQFAEVEGFEDDAYGIKRMQGMVKFMFSEDWSNRMPQFVEYIERMDQIRQTDFRKVFPEMTELLEIERTSIQLREDHLALR